MSYNRSRHELSPYQLQTLQPAPSWAMALIESGPQIAYPTMVPNPHSQSTPTTSNGPEGFGVPVKQERRVAGSIGSQLPSTEQANYLSSNNLRASVMHSSSSGGGGLPEWDEGMDRGRGVPGSVTTGMPPPRGGIRDIFAAGGLGGAVSVLVQQVGGMGSHLGSGGGGGQRTSQDLTLLQQMEHRWEQQRQQQQQQLQQHAQPDAAPAAFTASGAGSGEKGMGAIVQHPATPGQRESGSTGAVRGASGSSELFGVGGDMHGQNASEITTGGAAHAGTGTDR